MVTADQSHNRTAETPAADNGKRFDPGLWVVGFDDPQAVVPERVGGKGANLGRLTQAGFEVPPGFCITTDAYAWFLHAGDVSEQLGRIAGSIDYANPERLEAASAELIDAVTGTTMPPALASAIVERYEALGPETRVAVRSSGTAEDLAGFSFAGLHDTILDVLGAEAVLDAVKRCWASLWTARAAAYRHDKQFVAGQAQMAVVVQTMVDADVAGVLFTANPFTTATDEMVVNAGWGLGETVVGGIIVPDEFVLQAGTLAVLDRTLGSKALRVVREPDHSGTRTEEVPDADRERFALSDDQLGALGLLGRRVQEYYGDFPQDIEWALAGGQFYLLQSRPVTGVEFSWDAEVDDFYDIPDAPEEIWTRAYADEAQNGAVTALTYSSRYSSFLDCWQKTERLFDSDAYRTIRPFKFHKGEIYYNTRWERKYVEQSALPALRAQSLAWTAPAEHQEILAAPFSWTKYARYWAKVLFLEPKISPLGALKRLEYWRNERAEELAGLPNDQLREISDRELHRYLERQRSLEREYGLDVIPALQLQFRDALGFLGLVVQSWYTGDNPLVFAGLITGSTTPTDTQKENAALWRLSDRVRKSPILRTILEDNEDPLFFAVLDESAEGRDFLAEYRGWAAQFAHRGHADRDMLYPSRADDPAIDARTLRMLVRLDDSHDPEIKEHEANARRQAAHDEVVRNLRGQPFGFAKAEVFKFVFELAHKWIAYRDNERQSPNDFVRHSIRRGFVEMGRRLHERGILREPDDFHHLSFLELYRLFDGDNIDLDLFRAKVAARRRDVDRMLEGQRPPKLLRRNRAYADAATDELGGDYLQGHSTNPGIVTAIARVVPRVAELSKVKPGDILVTHATDPGWTPVFLVISGIITETGGLVSHASCLAREYGLPAVQLENAMQHIPDGATIELNANTGQITVVN